jgi:hypothetical protein
MRNLLSFVAVAGLFWFTTAQAATEVFEFPLEPGQNTPSNESTGSGDCTITLDTVTGDVTAECSFSGLTSNANNVHIHGIGRPGVNAGVILGLTATAATSGTITGAGMLSADEVTAMRNGLTYINLHTVNFGGGEIRGQIVDDNFMINAGLNDAWVSDDAPFQGLFFTVFRELGVFFISWFTFDSEPVAEDATAVFGAADQRWVTGAGSIIGNTAFINVELTSGGIFNSSDPLADQEVGYGTITVIFISCSEARLIYEFPSIGLSGEMILTRVLPDNVEFCELLSGPQL